MTDHVLRPRPRAAHAAAAAPVLAAASHRARTHGRASLAALRGACGGRRGRGLGVFVAAVMCLGPAPADAGGTRKLQIRSFEGFDAGEVRGAAIEQVGDGAGRVTRGLSPGSTAAPGTTVFSCVGAGDVAYVGTSDSATIQRVGAPPKGRSTKRPAEPSAAPSAASDAASTTAADEPPAAGAKPAKAPTANERAAARDADPELAGPALTQVAALDGVVVSALALLPSGDLVAATLPGGALVRIPTRGAAARGEVKPEPFATLAGVTQIWALRVHQGQLYAATGPKGELWAIGLDGKGAKVVMDTDETDLLTMASVGDELVVGTAPGAKLFRPSEDLEGVLLADLEGDEARALAPTRDGLVVAVNTFDDRKITSLDSLTKNLARASLVDDPPQGSNSGGEPPKAKVTVRYVDLRGPASAAGLDLDRATDAPWETWLTRKGQFVTSALATDGGDAVLVAMSGEGKIYRLKGDRAAATVADLDERQVNALCPVRGAAWGGPAWIAAAGDGPAVVALQSGPARTPRYRSKVHDAEQPARWGAIELHGRGGLALRARVGPTPEPDARWTPWTTIALSRTETSAWRGQLANLRARRYLQLEVVLGSDDAELRELTAFYGPENLAPRLTKIAVAPPKPSSGADSEPKPEAKITWNAEARDEDELVYVVRVRPEGGGDETWIPLHDPDEPVDADELAWDLRSVPDGVYEVGVVASDEPSNGVTAARVDQIVSDPIVVDRGRPDISDVQVNGAQLRATIADDRSLVHDASVSVDGGPFRPAAAVDGLFDDRREVVVFTLPELGPGPHRVVVRARDAAGNLASTPTIVTGPGAATRAR